MQKFKTITAESMNGVTVASISGVIEYVNDYMANAHGYSAKDLIGKNVKMFYNKEQFPKVGELRQKLLMCGKFTNEEVWHAKKDGSVFPMLMSGVLKKDEKGNPIYQSATALDITIRKEAENALRISKEIAEDDAQRLDAFARELEIKNLDLDMAMSEVKAASKTKSEFLANMSHEIRTPMNGVIGMTDLTLATELTNTQREYLEIVKRSANSLLSLLNDILDFSKIEAGKLDMRKIGFNLNHPVGDTISSFANLAHAKGLELISYVKPDVPLNLIGDPERLKQILVNLIGNSIKFTDKGEIALTVSLNNNNSDNFIEKEKNKNLISLLFSVKDSGIGIPKNKQEGVFDSFKQVDGSYTRKYGGTGLGLAISKKLVKMLNGKIWVQSKLDEGSIFFFTAEFIINEDSVSPPKPSALEELHNVKTVVIDDNFTNLKVLTEYMKNFGFQISALTSPQAAFLHLQAAHKANEPYQLALIDMQMPLLNGIQLSKKIKNDPALSSLKIIMLTSSPDDEDMKTCRKIGVEDYLSKPIQPSALLKSIMKVFTNKITKETASVFSFKDVTDIAENPENEKKLIILLVEDDKVNQIVSTAILQNAGHKVTLAENGREAIKSLWRNDFDLVLMDIQMPVMDGITATERIRAEKSTQIDCDIPIFAMTAHAMKGDREKCLNAGMDAYITKPVVVKILEKKIKELQIKLRSNT